VSEDAPEFLDVEDVEELHRLQLARFGGGDGVRDPGLLASAVAQAQMSFGGEFVHEGLFEMAAAYLFHLVRNHPFVDGNKRVGLLSALTFLDLNGIPVRQPASESLYELTMGVAEGRIDRPEVARVLRRAAGAAKSK
jgi:death-on-curing protein